MPIPDFEIEEWAECGGIKPYCEDHLNPASIDICLSDVWRNFDDPTRLVYSDTFTLYPRNLKTELYNLLAKLFRRQPRVTMVMALTRERINIPENMAAMVKLKSSLIREGLGYPIADWVDPGFTGHLTLVLTAYRPTTLKCGQRVAQLVLENMGIDCRTSYKTVGHYNEQLVPTLSWRRNGHGNHVS